MLPDNRKYELVPFWSVLPFKRTIFLANCWEDQKLGLVSLCIDKFQIDLSTSNFSQSLEPFNGQYSNNEQYITDIGRMNEIDEGDYQISEERETVELKYEMVQYFLWSSLVNMQSRSHTSSQDLRHLPGEESLQLTIQMMEDLSIVVDMVLLEDGGVVEVNSVMIDHEFSIEETNLPLHLSTSEQEEFLLGGTLSESLSSHLLDFQEVIWREEERKREVKRVSELVGQIPNEFLDPISLNIMVLIFFQIFDIKLKFLFYISSFFV